MTGVQTCALPIWRQVANEVGKQIFGSGRSGSAASGIAGTVLRGVLGNLFRGR